MTQLEKARQGKTTREMRKVAKAEGISLESFRKAVASGRAVVPANRKHRKLTKVIGIGKGLQTKINANLGTSPNCVNIREEIEKAKVAIKYGAHTVMDLSTGGDIDRIRKKMLRVCNVPLGTVPVYQTVIDAEGLQNVKEGEFIDTIEKHVKDGVDFVTVHAGVIRKHIPLLRKRTTGVVSRGGSLIVKWMEKNRRENPLYANFDAVLDAAKKYDVTVSLGDSLRPGSIADATDAAQIAELKLLGKLTERARNAGVQVIVEGPGHIPLNQIKRNMELQKKYCKGAPFYVLGPLVTDIAPGYDHITSAIGGAIAATYGADFLCYVTPAEHLRLPDVDDVKEGVIASRIAAHAADIARGINGASKWDLEMSKARKKLDWNKVIKLAIDSEKAYNYRRKSKIKENYCTMCGEFCAMK